VKPSTPAKIVRLTHRWTGLFLIVLLTLKMLSGLSAAGKIGLMSPAWAYRIHYTPFLDVPLILAGLVHALYGIYKIIQGWFSRKDILFIVINTAALLLSGYAILMVYFI
jgi:succinate dehydrogenase/fumarate reductase cytochrome b subunit